MNCLKMSLVRMLACHVASRCGRRGDLMVSPLDSGLSSLGSNHEIMAGITNVVVLGKTLFSHSASLQPEI